MKSKIFFITLLLSVFTMTATLAQSLGSGAVQVDHPWARETPPGVSNGAVYAVFQNQGERPDRLLSVTADIAEKIELHRHKHDNGVMRHELLPTVELPARDTVVLEPGGLHIMLVNLKQPLKKGESFPLTLQFERDGTMTIEVVVESP